jgi:hypothetical protein
MLKKEKLMKTNSCQPSFSGIFEIPVGGVNGRRPSKKKLELVAKINKPGGLKTNVWSIGEDVLRVSCPSDKDLPNFTLLKKLDVDFSYGTSDEFVKQLN